VLIFGFSVYKLINFFHPNDVNDSKPEQTIQENSELNSVSESSNQLPIQIAPPLSTQWRITGELQKSGKNFVVLADNQGNLRLEPRSSFNFTGRMLEGIIDNQRVNYYSGVKQ